MLSNHDLHATALTPVPQLKNLTELKEEDLFSKVSYNPEAGEIGGYSGYSYWKSVWTTFLHNKLAVALLIVFLPSLSLPLLPAPSENINMTN